MYQTHLYNSYLFSDSKALLHTCKYDSSNLNKKREWSHEHNILVINFPSSIENLLLAIFYSYRAACHKNNWNVKLAKRDLSRRMCFMAKSVFPSSLWVIMWKFWLVKRVSDGSGDVVAVRGPLRACSIGCVGFLLQGDEPLLAPCYMPSHAFHKVCPVKSLGRWQLI